MLWNLVNVESLDGEELPLIQQHPTTLIDKRFFQTPSNKTRIAEINQPPLDIDWLISECLDGRCRYCHS